MQDEPRFSSGGLPSSTHTEVAILGAMIDDRIAVEDAASKLLPDDFTLDSHRLVFRAMLRMASLGNHIDFNTVREELTRAREIDAIGGPAYLAYLTEGIPRNLNIESYVRIVKNASLARRGIGEFEYSKDILHEGGEDARKALEGARDRLSELIEDHEDPDLHHVSEYFKRQPNIDAIYDRMATTKGIQTAIAGFNKLTMGYQPKALSVIAARPSVGKTAKMVCDAYHAAVIEGKITAIFTLEQDENDIIRRMLSGASNVAYAAIKSGALHKSLRGDLMDAQERIMAAPLYITDQPGMTASRIRSLCARLKRDAKGLDIVFIDQLSRLKSSDVYRKGMQGREIIGEQTSIFKLMAQELDTAVVLLCQLRRFDGKGEARPTLEHLKDSGDIEEDSDLVQLLHRPKYYKSSSDEADEIIIAKQREGEIDTVFCCYNGEVLRWQETDDPRPRQAHFDGYFKD